MPDNTPRPYSIRIFVPDGDPDGLRMVEKSNWTGVGVVFNRASYKQVLCRPEFERTGVYVLVGQDEQNALPTVYVGEGDPVKNRLNTHYSKKDFWNWAIFFVTKDGSLNKAHVKYLESRLVGLAKSARQCRLDNDTGSNPPTLTEAETADVENFLLDMLSIYPLLGLNVFELTEIPAKLDQEPALLINSGETSARGVETSQGFIVLRGSAIRDDITPSLEGTTYARLRQDLLEQGVIARQGSAITFTDNYTFSSPSAAATVVLGRPANGRLEWKNAEGKSLKQLEQELSRLMDSQSEC